jgi:iron(III)-salmochelin esterase
VTRTWGSAASALLLALGLGCSRREPAGSAAHDSRTIVTSAASVTPLSSAAAPAASAHGTRLPAEERTWVFENTQLGRMVAVVLLPEREPTERLPVLLAFHGRGEALKGPDRGARGWIDDYALKRAIRRLSAPPLTSADFESFVSRERLERLNTSLAARPYRGMFVVCPYTPDVLGGEEPFAKAPPLAEFVDKTLLPKIRRDVPVLDGAIGIDGVSLGGRAAFGVGLLAPRSFRAIAGLQAAFDVNDAGEIAERAKRAHAENPQLVFRLLTSTGDYFREADTAIARALQSRGLPAELVLVEGPHDYAFNRGPGALEMLIFHDRALRGEAAL